MTRILGLDPGSVRLGYGCIDVSGSAMSLVECGVLSAPEKHHKYARLVELGRDLEALILELKPDLVALEAGFVKGQQGALTSGAARGVCAYIAGRRGIPVTEYAPATVKKAATGYGAATKDQVASLMKTRFQMKTTPAEDASDALSVAVCHAQSRK